MFSIRDTIADDDLGTSQFRCDLRKCRGACCTLKGGRGAPIEEAETTEIEAAFPVIRKLLPPEHLEAIELHGLYEGHPGERTTVCVNDRACVFAFFEGDIARCSFQRAFDNGEIAWRKPISCHLFPLRVRRFGKEYIHYEQIEECQPARELGEASGTRLHEFLEGPLVRKYGDAWYQELRNYCARPPKSRRSI